MWSHICCFFIKKLWPNCENIRRCKLLLWISWSENSSILQRSKLGWFGIFFHVSFSQLGEFIQLENLALSDGKRSRIWIGHNLTLLVQQTNFGKMSFHSGSEAKIGSCRLQLKLFKKRKLWWSPSQYYHCFKKHDVCGFEQMSDKQSKRSGHFENFVSVTYTARVLRSFKT